MAVNDDMQAHSATYSRVVAVVKWGAIACFLLAAIVVLIISRR